MLLKIQLEKNSFEMLKLPLGGDEDTDSPLYLELKQLLTFLMFQYRH